VLLQHLLARAVVVSQPHQQQQQARGRALVLWQLLLLGQINSRNSSSMSEERFRCCGSIRWQGQLWQGNSSRWQQGAAAVAVKQVLAKVVATR
jgi:hypothetical protein